MTQDISNAETAFVPDPNSDMLTDARVVALLSSPVEERIDPTPFTRLFPSGFFETLAARCADPQLSRMFRGLAGIGSGMTAFDVGKNLGVHSQTVTIWVMKFRKMQIDDLVRKMDRQAAISATGEFSSETLRCAASEEADGMVSDAMMAVADVMDGAEVAATERKWGIQPGWLERKLNGKKLKSAAAVRALVAAHRIGLRKDIPAGDIERSTDLDSVEVAEKSLAVIKLLYEGHDFTSAARALAVPVLKVRGWHAAFMAGGIEALVECGSVRDGRNKKTPREDVSREAVAGILSAAADEAVKARCRAIIAWMDRETASVMAEAGNVSRQSVQLWKDRFNEYGTEWLLHGSSRRSVRESRAVEPASNRGTQDDRRNAGVARRTTVRDEDVILLARRVERAIRYKVPLSLAAVRNWLRIEREIEATNEHVAGVVKAAGFHLHGDHIRSEPSQNRTDPAPLAA